MKKAVLLLAAVSAFAQANQTDVEKKTYQAFTLVVVSGLQLSMTTVFGRMRLIWILTTPHTNCLAVTSSTVSSQSKRNTHAMVIFLTSLKMHHAQW